MAVGATQPLKVSATTTAVSAGAPFAVPLLGGGESVLVYNATTAVVFIAFGTSGTVTASATTGTPVPPGSRMLLGISKLVAFAAICVGASGTGTGTVYLSRGIGDTY